MTSLRETRYALHRIREDGATEPVAAYPTFEEGWSEGQRAVHADRDHAYRLALDGQTVAKFGYARLSPRLSVSNLDALVIS